jgi:hypothetical protein
VPHTVVGSRLSRDRPKSPNVASVSMLDKDVIRLDISIYDGRISSVKICKCRQQLTENMRALAG